MSEFEAEHGNSTEPKHLHRGGMVPALPQPDAGAAAESVGEIEAQGEAHDGGGAEGKGQAAGDISKEAPTASVETGGQEEEHTMCQTEVHGSCSGSAGLEEGGGAHDHHHSHGCSHEGHDHDHEVTACSCCSLRRWQHESD